MRNTPEGSDNSNFISARRFTLNDHISSDEDDSDDEDEDWDDDDEEDWSD